jgi:putative hydrolase
MIFYGDYHTHTVYSDGKNSIGKNVAAAVFKGLKEVAITDHGFRNAFCLKRREVAMQKKEIELCREKYPDIKILYGIEADLVGADGRIDMDESDFDDFDLVIAGFHPSARPYTFKDFGLINLSTYYSVIFKPSKDIIRRNTKAATDMLNRYDIDIYPHINHSFYVDVKEVAKACADTGTYMELNAKHIDRRIFEILCGSEAKLVANTDAHRRERVGDMSVVEGLAKECGIELDRIENFKNPIALKRKRESKRG